MNGMRSLLAVTLLLGCSALAPAQDVKTDVTKLIGLDQRLGAQIPLDTRFTDENGKEVKLRQYFGERPVLLSMVFYGCKGSCLLIRDGLLKTLNGQKALHARDDFEVLVVSVHPKETPALALETKKSWVTNYRTPGTEDSWHFLTGDMVSIRALAQAVGFRFTYDEAKNAVSHPAGLILLTPDGITSHYMYGVTYAFKDFHDAVLAAAENKVGEKSPEILWGCMQYDPRTGKYRIVVENVMKVAGIATVLVLGCSIAVMSFRNRREPIVRDQDAGEGGAKDA